MAGKHEEMLICILHSTVLTATAVVIFFCHLRRINVGMGYHISDDLTCFGSDLISPVGSASGSSSLLSPKGFILTWCYSFHREEIAVREKAGRASDSCFGDVGKRTQEALGTLRTP